MSDALLEAHDVVAGYVPGLPIVHGVSLQVSAREVVSIIGPNGAGKSRRTLLKALIGMVPLAAGRVTLRGADVTGLPSHALVRRGLAFVPQTGNIFSTLTVQENLIVGGHTVATGLAGPPCACLRCLPRPRVQTPPEGERAVGRSAADAGDRPRTDDGSGRHPAR